MEPPGPPATAPRQRDVNCETINPEKTSANGRGRGRGRGRMLQSCPTRDPDENVHHGRLNGHDNRRRPPWRARQTEPSSSDQAISGHRRIPHDDGDRSHHLNGNGGEAGPVARGSGRFRRNRQPMQDHRGQDNKLVDDRGPLRGGEQDTADQSLKGATSGRLPRPAGDAAYGAGLQARSDRNGRFHNGCGRRPRTERQLQDNWRSRPDPPQASGQSREGVADSTKDVDTGNCGDRNAYPRSQPRTEQNPRRFNGRNENWRATSNRGGFEGGRTPRRSQRRREGPKEKATDERAGQRSVEDQAQVATASDKPAERRVVDLPRKATTEEDLAKLRATEIELFKKRFPKSKSSNEDCFEFTFSPSDPDWPFDVRHIQLEVNFSPTYPTDRLAVKVINQDEVLPALLVEDIDAAIVKWIDFFHKEGQLSFRPFLRWIDRNLQEIFVESLRKIKRLQTQPVVVFVDQPRLDPAPQPVQGEVADATSQELRQRSEETSDTAPAEEPVLKALPKKHERLADLEEGLDSVGSARPDETIKVAYQGAVNSNQLAKILNNYDPHSAARKGIEVKFRHVDISESVSFLVCDRLLVSVQCKKCKKIADFQLLPGRRSVTSCAKCQTKLEACFRPCILLQFNPVLGYLELQECTIRDVALSRCHFYADCQRCSKLSPLDGMHLGQRASSNCVTCGDKMQIIMDSIKYMDMCAIEANIKATQMKKANKDSSIQAGKPLPNKGICKHYKKSFRWFRFPCCGKAFPCDDCHNEQETDHTAEFASRMICGFCAKEQPFSNDKPCSQCSNLITGKRTAHWEGGKGCRNKTKMSTNDAKKYSGLNKTISRKNTTSKAK